MTIAFVTSKLNLTTAGGSVPDLDLKMRLLSAKGHKIIVITVFSAWNKRDDLVAALPYDIREEHVNTKKIHTIQYGVYRLLKKYQASVDVFHVEGQFLYGAGAYRRFGGTRPIVSFFNRELVSWPNPSEPVPAVFFSFFSHAKQQIRFWIEKYIAVRLARYIDFCIFTNPFLQKEYERFGLRIKSDAIMPDFVDGSKLRASLGRSLPHKEERGKQKTTWRICCTGRMIPTKGFDVVIRAATLLKNKISLHIIMSGDGPERSRLETLAEKLGVRGYIDFPGWVDKQQLLSFLSESDIFILPKWRRELTSVLLLEAMAFGTPCLVPKGGALAWLAGDAALTFTEDNAAELSQAIMTLCDDGPSRVRLSAAAVGQLERYDCQRMAQTLEHIFIENS